MAPDRRSCILEAAFDALTKDGYRGASTLKIATRAKVSKRELYAEFGDKQGILAALISSRAARMRQPLELPAVQDRRVLIAVLEKFGATLLRELSHPSVTAMFRLAVAEAEHAPQVARTLDAAGRETNRVALCRFLAQAQTAGLLGHGEVATMAGQFLSLLTGDMLMRLLLGVREPPGAAEIERRAQAATAALLQLHAVPQ